MFFQISPVVHKKSKPVIKNTKKDDDAEPEILSLAPFTSNPKIVFNDVLVGTTQSRLLLIKNPTGCDVHLFVKKALPSDSNIDLSWNEILVNQNEEVILELTWNPIVAESCRHTFTLSDGKRVNRDIAVILKSVNPKSSNNNKLKSKKNLRGPVTLPLIRRLSPPKKLKPQKKSPFKVSFTPSKEQSFSVYSPPSRPVIRKNPSTTTSYVKQSVWQDENKENVRTHFTKSDESFVSPSHVLFTPSKQMRETFNLTRDTYVVPPSIKTGHFHDSLEIPSITPLKELTTNDKTPTLESLLNNRSRFEDKLNRKFNLSPMTLGDISNSNLAGFVPSLSSTNSKPPSTKDSCDNLVPLAAGCRLFSPSNDTYTKSNISSETYVKDCSGETYVKEDLSGSTYIKDSLGVDNTSPYLRKTCRTPSPVLIKNFQSNSPQISPKWSEPYLSAIVEESNIFNESSLRSGAKRKIVSFNGQPAIKRERTEHEPKKDWSKMGGSAFTVAKTTTGLKMKRSAPTSSPNHLTTIRETNKTVVIVKNPFLYGNVIDPFLNSSVYRSEEWLDKQEKNFTKWLNALLTPPSELSAKNEVDVAKVWQACMKKEVPLAPTKEAVSFCYNITNKLDKLRQAAQQLFYSKEISTVLQKVCLAVDSGKLSIREDKDVHRNLKLKSEIISIILGYNPLWLRLGLETIYNEVIPLKSNSDSHGLMEFLLHRFLADPYLLRKYKTVVSPKYSADLKKFLLKKLLMLVYFLDQAKNVKLIAHDPCLFCKNAVEKDSKSVLTHFARETLSAVGDITKYLKCHGYVVTYVQSYIHEFDYAVNNLGGDLRDGVRLTKVMEIIQMRDDLTNQLRVPAISRLQKVHNNQIVFKSLIESGYEIQFDITPKDLVDGHREKTLSFLWQIIYKFEAPLMSKSATTIQKWFRSLPIVLKRRKILNIRRKREEAALKIESWYLRIKKAVYFETLSVLLRKHLEECRRDAAVRKLQSFFKMILYRRRYLMLQALIVKLQAYSRGWLIRHNYSLRNTSAIIIQRIFKTFICRRRFLEVKHAVIILQRRYRAAKQRQIAVQSFQEVKKSAVIIQRRFRAVLAMKACKFRFLQIKLAAVTIQSHFRMYYVRREYITYRNTIVTVQRRFRAILAMKHQMRQYHGLRKTVILVQSRYRAKLIGRKTRTEFMNMRKTVVFIQRRFRALCLMNAQKREYLELRRNVLLVQRRFRANALMKTQKSQFDSLKRAAITIQRRFRGLQAMRIQRQNFIQLKCAAIIIQRSFRAKKVIQTCRANFIQMRQCIVITQRRFRATLLARKNRSEFLKKRQSIINIQIRFRASQQMKLQRRYFLELRHHVVIVQRRFRATVSMRTQMNEYNLMKKAAITIQRRFRARQVMRTQLRRFNECKHAVITIQHWFRARLMVKTCRFEYIRLRNAAMVIQRRYRATLLSKKVRIEFLEIRRLIVRVQIRFRSLQAMKGQRKQFLEMRQSSLLIQRRLRATLLMKTQRDHFLALKSATLTVQRRFRANCAMKVQREYFSQLKNSTVLTQKRFRANTLAKTCREHYLRLRTATLLIQRRFRANKQAAIELFTFSRLRWAAIVIQQRHRARIIMRLEMNKYRKLRYSCVILQRRIRAWRLGKEQRHHYLSFKKSVVTIQRYYRNYQESKKQRAIFLQVRKSIMTLQPWLKGYMVRKKYAALLTPEAIQARKLLKIQSAAAVKIQAYWRGYAVRTSQMAEIISMRMRSRKRCGSFVKTELNKERTLAERSEAAMLCVTGERPSLKQMITALEDLDFVTRHCREICLSLSELLPNILYVYITSASRSAPEADLVNSASLILINFYKYPETRNRSWDPHHIDDLINIMLHWCDKESNLFSSMCTLVWLFAHEPKWKKVILKVPNLNQKIGKIYTLIQRKQKMVKKSRQVNNTSVFGHLKETKLPCLNADWGLNCNGPNAFVNALQAIKCLMKILDFNNCEFT